MAWGERITTITDPAGLVTTMTYSGGRLTSVGGPVGRETLFEHDLDGNLIRIIAPDASEVDYAYDARGRLTAVTNQRGFATTHDYGFAGQFTGSGFPVQSISWKIAMISPGSTT